MIKIFALLVCLAIPQVYAAQNSAPSQSLATESNSEEFLEPDQAFKLSLSAVDSQTLKANFTVAPGHYLYRQRISFKLNEGASASIANVNFPKGEIKKDPNFG
jgi:thiol:disulfide interchange protein DsbD